MLCKDQGGSRMSESSCIEHKSLEILRVLSVLDWATIDEEVPIESHLL